MELVKILNSVGIEVVRFQHVEPVTHAWVKIVPELVSKIREADLITATVTIVSSNYAKITV